MTYDAGGGSQANVPPPGYDPNAAFAPQAPQPMPYMTPAPGGPAPQSQPFGQIFVTALLVVLAFTAGWLGNAAFNSSSQGSQPASARKYASDIWTAWNDIDQYYVNPSAINHQQMTYAMIDAMVNSLGDTGHSRFLTPSDVAQLNSELSNSSFVGIGVYLQQETTANGQQETIIEATIPNSPAQKAGLMPGDVFVAVNGQNVANDTIDQLSALVRGNQGTAVSITVQRPGVAAPITVSVTRASVTAPIVVSDYFPADHIGYVQITGFDTGAGKELTSTLQSLQAEGAQSLILDLRGNPGGLVDEAVNVASDFLPAGATVVVEKNRDGSEVPLKVGTGLHLTMPMAILVDNGTASAAEIVTGAIQDNRPTVPVIGERTFGTDTVLVSFDLPDGSELLLGIQEYLTPKLRQFKPGQGLMPSQVVALPPNSFPVTPLVLQESKLTEQQVLSGKGISNDTQLIAAIKALQKAGG